MHELAAQYPRYGSRRTQVFRERRSDVMSTNRAHRVRCLHQLQVPGKWPRRRVAASRPRPLPATGMGQVSAYDFVFDPCANGQQLKCLTVADEFSREYLDVESFRNRVAAKFVIQQVRRKYNEVRPHSSLGQLTPEEFKQTVIAANNPEQAVS